MEDCTCPVCGAQGISGHERAFIRLYGYVVTCHGCGAKLTVGFWESILSLVPFFIFLGVGFIFENNLARVVFLALGLFASWQWSVRFVPLVPTGSRTKAH